MWPLRAPASNILIITWFTFSLWLTISPVSYSSCWISLCWDVGISTIWFYTNGQRSLGIKLISAILAHSTASNLIVKRSILTLYCNTSMLQFKVGFVHSNNGAAKKALWYSYLSAPELVLVVWYHVLQNI